MITASGGAGGYTYAWSNGETTDDLSNLLGGTYSITVTDGANCTASSVINLQQPAFMEVLIDTIINNSGSGTPLAMGNVAPIVHWGTTDVDDYIPAATITSPANAEHPPAYQFEGVDPEDDPTGAYTDKY